jgi:hypothetical protein
MSMCCWAMRLLWTTVTWHDVPTALSVGIGGFISVALNALGQERHYNQVAHHAMQLRLWISCWTCGFEHDA